MSIIVKNLIFDMYFMNTLRSWCDLRCLILLTAESAKVASPLIIAAPSALYERKNMFFVEGVFEIHVR